MSVDELARALEARLQLEQSGAESRQSAQEQAMEDMKGFLKDQRDRSHSDEDEGVGDKSTGYAKVTC